MVIGGGPAGLMAAEQLAEAGCSVAVFDAMPSLGRKFLRAGIGGLNLTHSEAADTFVARYGNRREQIASLLAPFDAAALRQWAHGLGVDTFIGSSGRVFPREMKAAPLLRNWLRRLRSQGVRFHTRHRWLGWTQSGGLRFDTPHGKLDIQADAIIFALGGASWSALGSDGRWAELFRQKGIDCAPFLASNSGFNCPWPREFANNQAGAPLKNIGLSVVMDSGKAWQGRGDAIVSEYGIEGGLVYAASQWIRDAIMQNGDCAIYWDLLPDKSEANLQQELASSRSKDSTSNQLRKLGVNGVKLALLKACCSKEQMQDTRQLPALLKRLPLTLTGLRPIDEAISTAGGVSFDGLTEGLMLQQLPGNFCAGEMLDWEAPTGGYLLTACFASGRLAGRAAAAYLKQNSGRTL